MAREAQPVRELELVLLLGAGAAWPGEPGARARWDAAGGVDRARALGAARRLRAFGVRSLIPGAPPFPPAALEVPNPPAALFVRGRELPEPARAVAVVGTRAATPYGVGVARLLARSLARVGVAVVSGLARGIDAAAHLGALEAGGHTVAVLPGGVDTAVPAHHGALAERIAVHGTLVSEYATGKPFGPAAFVRRNRLIAALSAATVVVEAGERSGALSTAAVARRLGRACLAVPADVDRPQSRGCLDLLRGGARVCADPADVLACLRALPASRAEVSLPEAQRAVAECLAAEGRRADEIARRAARPLPEVLRALMELEVAGLARALPGQRYARARGAGRV